MKLFILSRTKHFVALKQCLGGFREAVSWPCSLNQDSVQDVTKTDMPKTS